MSIVMRRWMIIVILMVSLIYCSGCSSENENDTDPGFDLGLLLKSQVDLTKDEGWPEGDTELLILHSIQVGSFTQDDTDELLAIFRPTFSPHAAGLERSIAAIYDGKTHKLITQKTFAADAVSLYLFNNSSGRSRILSMLATTYQGISVHYLELWHIEGSTWTAFPVSERPLEANYGYALTGTKDILIYDKRPFDSYYDTEAPSPEIFALLRWDEYREIFVP